jgi:K+/H+ antiporter YhaU regulatory subunit KhtT
VVGVLRKGSFISNPSADLVFEVGDLVALIGKPQQQETARGKMESSTLAS